MNTTTLLVPAALLAGLFSTASSAHDVVVSAALPGVSIVIGAPPPPARVVVVEPAPAQVVYRRAPPPARVVYRRPAPHVVVVERPRYRDGCAHGSVAHRKHDHGKHNGWNKGHDVRHDNDHRGDHHDDGHRGDDHHDGRGRSRI
jgi:hypothetical protein